MDGIREKNSGMVYQVVFSSWSDSLPPLLDASKFPDALADVRKILVKPNLVEALDPPITTPVSLVAAIVSYLKARTPHIEIVIAEGSGAKEYETSHAFDYLGYRQLAEKEGIELLDLNDAELVRLEKPGCRRWPEMYLPKIVFESFLLSVPVLKVHTLADVTLTMKNMMGLAPPSHYQQGGHWKKASFHSRVQDSVLDLNRYRCADFTILDATVGMQEAHLWGPPCDPPHNILAASFDPVAIDAYGAGLLGIKWNTVGHIAGAHRELGLAEPLKIIDAGV
ncbi:MAG: DUF362 domain-containing protein [Proteobacteria bacterium]|nr:DUF362 domain-containing protein [Pseudomonadota bacterium]MBU1711307.1 DUF362 domain-containing protein [Pseudomonadota bacterium]